MLLRLAHSLVLALLALAGSPAAFAKDPPSACRAAAALPTDGGVNFERLDAARAIPACEAELRRSKDDPALLAYYGRALLKARRFDDALKALRRAAEEGNATASIVLASMYEEGLGVAEDEKEAIRLYEAAAAAGHPVAETALGLIYEKIPGSGPHRRDAARLFRSAALKGYAPAQFHLGRLLETGRGIAKDERAAASLYALAAEGGLPRARAKLGSIRGVPPTPADLAFIRELCIGARCPRQEPSADEKESVASTPPAGARQMTSPSDELRPRPGSGFSGGLGGGGSGTSPRPSPPAPVASVAPPPLPSAVPPAPASSAPSSGGGVDLLRRGAPQEEARRAQTATERERLQDLAQREALEAALAREREHEERARREHAARDAQSRAALEAQLSELALRRRQETLKLQGTPRLDFVPPPEVPAPVASVPARPAQAAAASKPAEVERFPTVEAPEQIAPGVEFVVEVSLTEEQITPEVLTKRTGEGVRVTEGGALALSLDPAAEEWELDVVLQASGIAPIPGSSNLAKIVLPKKGDSTSALFRLKAGPNALGTRDLRVTFWWEGRYLAQVVRPITVARVETAGPATRAAPGGRTGAQAPGTQEGPRALMAAQPESASAPSPRPKTFVAPALKLAGISAPDLTVHVVYDDPARLGPGRIIVASPHLRERILVDAIHTPPEVADWLQARYHRFVQLGRARGVVRVRTEPAERVEPIALMRGFGGELYKRYAPDLFKRVLERLASDPQVDLRTIQVYSNNPVLPWELMRPVLPDGKELDFLALQYNFARWHVTNGARQLDRPVQNQEFRRLVALAPAYGQGQALPAQAVEMEELKRVAGFERWGGSFADLTRLMADPPAGIVHFSGHGTVSGLDAARREFSIRLEDRALDALTWRGLVGRGAKTTSLFFFNACDVGQAEPVAGVVDGWAPAVLEAGASGYIGGLWPLLDAPAARFASRFYAEVERYLARGDPAPVAEALKAARQLFYETGDPTYLAYAFYGDANMSLSR